MKKHLLMTVATILALSRPEISKAQLFFTADIGGVPSVGGATLDNLDEPNPSILSFSGPASLTTAPSIGVPYFSGSTAALFGETPTTGYDASQSVLVSPGGAATLTFLTPQHYLGLCWGSIDPYTGMNTLTFYDNANNVIGTIEGQNVVAANGALSAGGTAYVNVTSTTAFKKVVATATPIYPESFEFDDVAYAQVVPEPASCVLFAGGLCILGLALRRKHS